MRDTLNKLVPGSTWSAFGVGKGAMEIMYAAIAAGGNIRVGMEDNVVYARNPDGTKIMATNLMLVQRAANAIRAFGNEVATPAAWLGKSLRQVNVRSVYSLNILAIVRDGTSDMMPSPDYIFNARDHLMVLGTPVNIARMIR